MPKPELRLANCWSFRYFLQLFLMFQRDLCFLQISPDSKAKIRARDGGDATIQPTNWKWLVPQKLLSPRQSKGQFLIRQSLAKEFISMIVVSVQANAGERFGEPAYEYVTGGVTEFFVQRLQSVDVAHRDERTDCTLVKSAPVRQTSLILKPVMQFSFLPATSPRCVCASDGRFSARS